MHGFGQGVQAFDTEAVVHSFVESSTPWSECPSAQIQRNRKSVGLPRLAKTLRRSAASRPAAKSSPAEKPEQSRTSKGAQAGSSSFWVFADPEVGCLWANVGLLFPSGNDFEHRSRPSSCATLGMLHGSARRPSSA